MGVGQYGMYGDLRLCLRVIFFKYDVQICRFWCILTAVQSLVLVDD